MMCREFKHSAAELTLRELSQRPDEQVLDHARECESCGGWLREQHSLASWLQSLQMQTATLEAGTDVERAVLRAFRERTAPPVTAESKERVVPMRSRPTVTPGLAPVAMRLSRFFEIGAYAAVAAAIVVVTFVGVRLLQHSSRAVQVQSQTAHDSTKPLMQEPVAKTESASLKPTSVISKHVTDTTHSRVHSSSAGSGTSAATPQDSAEESQSDADAEYMALMFCDPLSCATDSQVVRMELPSAPGTDGQSSPQMADVVVGYDGAVRAIRLVR
jgi:hypothetical protein